ncbi:MAG TPA: hypothetical protein VN577_08185 [Terriglobales bacterium]|nr:hypothetical protein [Terriglobales bacterium]
MASLDSLFGYSARECAATLLAVWAVAIGVFVCSKSAEKLIWIPVLLGIAGVLGSIVVLAIPAKFTLEANVVTLALFIVSFGMLKKRHPATAVVRTRR